MGYQPGDVIGERYQVEDRLGEGAHGAVYRAVDTMLGAKVAVKCLHPHVAAEPGLKTRMMREARVMGALSGTSAVEVRDFGKTDDGGMFIVMELINGRTLERYLRDIERSGGQISTGKVTELLGPIVDTLEAAHAQGVVHRDLKPGNIMVLDTLGRGPVRLLDFGLAKVLKADPLTLEGTITGSPSYIAPEGWLGKPDVIDHRVDVYALGAVVFRALGGEPPFDPEQPIDRFLVAVCRGERPSLQELRSDLPDAIDPWARRALAIDREKRFQTVRELWSAFLAAVG